MYETMIGTQECDQSFEVQIGPSGTGLWMPAPAYRPVATAVYAISDSNVAKWIAATFYNVGYWLDVEPGPDSQKIFLSPEEEFLTQMRSDLDELAQPVRSSPEAMLCRRFVEGVGKALAFIPHARCAVFGDEEDGVELVAHSRTSMRQVSFEFGNTDDTINIVSIDEEMRRFERACGIDKVRTLAEAIAWLNPH